MFLLFNYIVVKKWPLTKDKALTVGQTSLNVYAVQCSYFIFSNSQAKLLLFKLL